LFAGPRSGDQLGKGRHAGEAGSINTGQGGKQMEREAKSKKFAQGVPEGQSELGKRGPSLATEFGEGNRITRLGGVIERKDDTSNDHGKGGEDSESRDRPVYGKKKKVKPFDVRASGKPSRLISPRCGGKAIACASMEASSTRLVGGQDRTRISNLKVKDGPRPKEIAWKCGWDASQNKVW